jgi:CheY-like chemotaxis protein
VDSSYEIEPDEIEILIVEDSPTQAERLRRLIQSVRYKARVAANGRLALEAIRARKPHLVLSDIVMPEMDGYELCRAIKSDHALRRSRHPRHLADRPQRHYQRHRVRCR